MRTLERQSLTKQLMDVLIQNICTGDLPAGEKLPPEAELAEQLRVSRNTLREALKTLETFGIIESLHGQGTFVSATALQRIPNIEILKLLSENHDVQSLLDARLVIEPGLARLAALCMVPNLDGIQWRNCLSKHVRHGRYRLAGRREEGI